MPWFGPVPERTDKVKYARYRQVIHYDRCKLYQQLCAYRIIGDPKLLSEMRRKLKIYFYGVPSKDIEWNYKNYKMLFVDKDPACLQTSLVADHGFDKYKITKKKKVYTWDLL